MKQYLPHALGLFALFGLTYLVAWLWTATQIPGGESGLILTLLLVNLLLIPAAYYLLHRRWGNRREGPAYFIVPLDFMVFFIIYPTLLFLMVFIVPRLALWSWGTPTMATINQLVITEYFDIDLGMSNSYCLELSYAVDGRPLEGQSCVGEAYFSTLAEGVQVAAVYFPWWPRLIAAGDPFLALWQYRTMLWLTLVLGLWLAGAAFATARRFPPSPPPFPEPQSAGDLLARYGLDSWLTPEDDPELWAAVIQDHFPRPENETINVAGLKFGVGYFAPAAKLKIQPTAATAFDRVDQHHLQPATCLPDEQNDSDFDPDLAPAVPHLMIYVDRSNLLPRPVLTLLVPRPSNLIDELPVYKAIYRPNNRAFGETVLWQKQSDGSWKRTANRLNHWLAG